MQLEATDTIQPTWRNPTELWCNFEMQLLNTTLIFAICWSSNKVFLQSYFQYLSDRNVNCGQNVGALTWDEKVGGGGLYKCGPMTSASRQLSTHPPPLKRIYQALPLAQIQIKCKASHQRSAMSLKFRHSKAFAACRLFCQSENDGELNENALLGRERES